MGYPSRRAWLRSISSADYAELLAFSCLESVGLERTDEYAAAAASAFGGKIRGTDFRFSVTEEQTPEEQVDALAGIVVYGQEATDHGDG